MKTTEILILKSDTVSPRIGDRWESQNQMQQQKSLRYLVVERGRANIRIRQSGQGDLHDNYLQKPCRQLSVVLY